MAGFIRAYEKRPLVTCDFWFFAVIAVAVYFGGDALWLLLAALVHEAGHWLALLATNNGVLQLRLRGCCAQIIPHYRRLPGLRQELMILAAGPIAGIVFALLLSRLFRVLRRSACFCRSLICCRCADWTAAACCG